MSACAKNKAAPFQMTKSVVKCIKRGCDKYKNKRTQNKTWWKLLIISYFNHLEHNKAQWQKLKTVLRSRAGDRRWMEQQSESWQREIQRMTRVVVRLRLYLTLFFYCITFDNSVLRQKLTALWSAAKWRKEYVPRRIYQVKSGETRLGDHYWGCEVNYLDCGF